MVEVQDFQVMGEALGNACAVLRTNAASAGLRAPVPTCPGWTVGDLVTHQGLVHRWAAAWLTGRRGVDEAAVRAEARAATDLLDWFDDGMVEILHAIASAPANLEGRFFLPDAPPLRDAWLRRQVHETTIHAVDAMAARLSRPPAASELWFGDWLAADGIDELLTGFLVRRRPETSLPRSRTVAVRATDAGRSWLVRLTHDGAITTRGADDQPADTTVAGPARALFLALWNRARPEDRPESSAPDWWDDWAEHVLVAWS